MRLLYFSLHGDSAVEIALLCRAAGIQLDIAGTANDFLRAKSKPVEQIHLRRFGVEAPTDQEIVERIVNRRYAAIMVAIPDQVVKLRERLKGLSRNPPLIVRHSGNHMGELKRLGVENVLGPSPRALALMQPCHTFLKPKLLDWDELPAASHEAGERSSFASYVHVLARAWPRAWSKFVELNRLLAPQAVVNYGLESPQGIVNDVDAMRRCRATVHLKDSGMCCFAVLRSMAMGTPVVMDRETHERCYFDGLAGLLVKQSIPEVAEELKRLSSDDAYWSSASRTAYDSIRSYSTASAELGRAFHRFVEHSVPRLPTGVEIPCP